ncbi:MAG: sugar ABC transporter ATP-binding protein, partial [Spirochaetia bacterium]|nr:sugar ABC transporter ATP-binding protein [Spirochaetia bacterium]
MSDSTHDVLRIEGVTKRFQGTVALKSVSFTLRNHEILAIIGENGAGKSTMMKILSGLYPSSGVEGTIWIMGKEARFQNPIDAEKAGIAMIYQELNLELDLSIAENICLGAMPLNKFGLVDWAAVRKTATDALERLGIVIDVNVIARNLSPSMQQLVSIARALSRNPSILILDEPTSVLTSTETEKLMQIITGLKDKGLSCIYISHKLDEVFQLCDRIIVFRDGCYISEHTRTNGYKSTEIIQEMIGRDLEVMYPQIEHSVGNELLRVEQLSVPHPTAYGKNIIEDVSFTLNKGEILGLAGLVGSGRSEILNAVFGGIRKNSGYLFLDGKKIDIQNPQDAKKHGIGLLTEDRKKNGIIPGLSIKHNMTITILDQLCN